MPNNTPPDISPGALDPLREWATPREAEAIDTVLSVGLADAAAAMGITVASVQNLLSKVRRKAAAKGHSPRHDMVHTVPEGFVVKGVSTFYDDEGNARRQWVKSEQSKSGRLEALLEAVADIAEPFRGASEVAAPPTFSNDDILVVYPMGDPHVGMYAWAEESGEDFNLEIAERNMVAAVDHLVSLAPPAREALIINLGDYFHADSNANTTTRGTRVDVDTRWAKVLRVGIRAFRRIIDRAKEKHETVRVICAIGNHDDHTAQVLAVALHGFYENDPRVIIEDAPTPTHRFRFGACLLGVHHGHSIKRDALPQVMATDWPVDWGATKYRHWYTGHVHHDTLKEYRGCTVETFRTLAAKDAWHAGAGYRSGRDMKCDVWHREHGMILRHRVGVAQLRGGS